MTALVLSEFLAAHGYRISLARNGPEGAPDRALDLLIFDCDGVLGA